MTAPLRILFAIWFGQSTDERLGHSLARRGLLVLALLSGSAETRAQTAVVPMAGVDGGLIEDIVVGSRILADFGVLDGFRSCQRAPSH